MTTGDSGARDLAALRALMARLPRTWPAFFGRHGSFTPAQRAAIPPLLDGAHLLLCAPTASGKTEAALAPLIERHCPAARPPRQLRILYLSPTRALVNDLRARLAHPLDTLGVRLGVKTGDGGFARGRPPDVLLTTPESLDALLASDARLFARLRAVVIDELHVFDGTPRGDQLRALLARLRRVRAYAAATGDAPDAALQLAALSATLPDAEGAAARFLAPAPSGERAAVIHLGGGRALADELVALGVEGEAALHAYLAGFRPRGWRKALAFCNSRAEVERYAAAVRAAGSFGGAVFTHYSNLEPGRRREIEAAFSAAEAAICFTSSTLELGIDIGTIDVSVLIGPPGSLASFAQRLGRANRRGGAVNVACCYRTPLERLLFQALIDAAIAPGPAALPANPVFRPSVAVQQIFSLTKQSPTAALRLAELAELFAGLLGAADLRAIVEELSLREYLAPGRPGELRAGPRLNALYDEQASGQPGLGAHSNIATSEGPTVTIKDQLTGRTVARVDALWLDRDSMTLEGRAVRVEWSDGEALWVSERPVAEGARPPLYRSGRQLLGLELARLLPRQLGLAPGEAPFVPAPAGCWWFHWLGDLYGRAALDLLRYTLPAQEGDAPGLALLLPDPPQAPPAWTEAQVTRYLHDSYRRYEPLLDLGAFQHLLPPELRRRAVVAAFDVPRFLAAVAELRPVAAPAGLAEGLERLVRCDE
jgi:ATP-dependent Lhr-like helicase